MRVADLAATRPDLLKMDQEFVTPSGVKYANLEVCDFFSKDKDFIHLKDGHSSGPISHLWAQGVVSADAFVIDAEFRKKLRAKVRSLGGRFEALLPKRTERVARDSYSIVYGVMRKPYADGTLGLPFFSKVSLQAAAERIAQFGIPLPIELIAKPASDSPRKEQTNDVAASDLIVKSHRTKLFLFLVGSFDWKRRLALRSTLLPGLRLLKRGLGLQNS